jgi:hypothetical protein
MYVSTQKSSSGIQFQFKNVIILFEKYTTFQLKSLYQVLIDKIYTEPGHTAGMLGRA